MTDNLSGKELFIRFTASAFRKLLSFYVFRYFHFGFEFLIIAYLFTLTNIMYVCVYMYACMYVCMRACVRAWVCACSIYIYIYCVCVYVCMYACLYVVMYVGEWVGITHSRYS